MLNQTIWHDEWQVLRLVIPPAGVTHPILGAFANKGCVPAPVTKTGTITTVSSGGQDGCTVLGTGTNFTGDTDFLPGRFLADNNGVVRMIKEVLTQHRIILVNKFPTDLTNNAIYLVTNKPRMIYCKSTGTVDATLQEAKFQVNDTFLAGGTPVSYDVSTANTEVAFEISY